MACRRRRREEAREEEASEPPAAISGVEPAASFGTARLATHMTRGFSTIYAVASRGERHAAPRARMLRGGPGHPGLGCCTGSLDKLSLTRCPLVLSFFERAPCAQQGSISVISRTIALTGDRRVGG